MSLSHPKTGNVKDRVALLNANGAEHIIVTAHEAAEISAIAEEEVLGTLFIPC